MDVVGASTENNTNVCLWNKDGGKNQKWKFACYGNGEGKTIMEGDYQIVSALGSDIALDVDGEYNADHGCSNMEEYECRYRHIFDEIFGKWLL